MGKATRNQRYRSMYQNSSAHQEAKRAQSKAKWFRRFLVIGAWGGIIYLIDLAWRVATILSH